MRSGVLAAVFALPLLIGAARGDEPANWYAGSFFLLHEDHHTNGTAEVGRDADADLAARLIGASRPDMIQIHAKGNPGWTTYPSAIGHVPPKLACDVLGLWRDIARSGGYHWSIYYNIGRDGQIMHRRPEWNRSAADGSEIDRALCYHSGVAEDYIWPMLDEIVEGYRPDGFWFDGSVFTIRPCYCDACRERFQQDTGFETPERPSDPNWAKFMEMQRQVYREFVRDTCQRVHRRAPDCLVAFNWAYSVRMPEQPDQGVAYLTGDIGNRVEGLSLEAHWYDGAGLPFDLMTTGHTFRANDAGRTQKVAKPRPQIEQEMAITIANGGRFHLWDTPSPTSGIDAKLHASYAEVVGPFLRAREPWCLGSRRLPDVSLLHSAAAHYSLLDKGNQPFGRRNNRIEGAADFLERLHVNFEMVGDWRLRAQDIHSPLLIVEHPRDLAAPEFAAIETFLHGGGNVLLTGMGSGIGRGRLRPAFGIEACAASSAAEPLTARIGASKFAFEHYLTRVEPAAKTQILATAIDARGREWPLVTALAVGDGTAYYAAIPLLTAHGPQTPPLEMVDAVLSLVAPRAERRLTTDAPEHIRVYLRENGANYIVHIVNMAKGERELGPPVRYGRPVLIHSLPEVAPFTLTIAAPARPRRIVAQPSGRRIDDWTFDGRRIVVKSPPVAVHEILTIQFDDGERASSD